MDISIGGCHKGFSLAVIAGRLIVNGGYFTKKWANRKVLGDRGVAVIRLSCV